MALPDRTKFSGSVWRSVVAISSAFSRIQAICWRDRIAAVVGYCLLISIGRPASEAGGRAFESRPGHHPYPCIAARSPKASGSDLRGARFSLGPRSGPRESRPGHHQTPKENSGLRVCRAAVHAEATHLTAILTAINRILNRPARHFLVCDGNWAHYSGNTLVQSFFMSTMIQPMASARSRAVSSVPTWLSRS
jgi:hypothetical protein